MGGIFIEPAGEAGWRRVEAPIYLHIYAFCAYNFNENYNYNYKSPG